MRVLARFSLYGSANSAKEDRSLLVEKYRPYFKKVTDFMLYMYTDQPQFEELLQEMGSKGFDTRCFYEIEWTKKEMDSAEFLILSASYECEEPLVKKSWDTHFKLRCERCKVHIEQTNDLTIKKKYAGKWDLYAAFERRRIASPRLRSILESAGVAGLSFRPVYTVKVDEPIGWQLIVENELPPVHPDSQLRIATDCPACGYTSYVYSQTEPITYGPEFRDTVIDGFNQSHESFGGDAFPRPITIVSQRIRQLFLQHKIKAGFEPIVIKGDTNALTGSFHHPRL